jgi:hypothetical protein
MSETRDISLENETEPKLDVLMEPIAATAVQNQIERRFTWEIIILRIAAIIVALGVIYGFIVKISDKPITPDNITTILVILNFIVLMLFCLVSVKTPVLTITDTANMKKYIDILSVDFTEKKTKEEQCLFNVERVNLLVKQINTNLILYAFFLILVYGIYILIALGLLNDGPNNHLFNKSLEDTLNFLSSVFIYLSFKVLYNTTLDEKTNNRIIYFMDAIFFSILYLAIYYVCIINFRDNKVLFHNLSLLCGIFNGLAMGLLFGRFISMEHAFMNLYQKDKNGKNRNYEKKIFYYSTIFILPLYVLVQPLFGDFEIDAFGNPKIFANVVFFVCLVGKSFFLLMFFIYTRRRWLHLYIHLIITKHGLPKDLGSYFDQKPS